MPKKEFIIYTKMLEVTLWLFGKVNTFPKKQRFVLGQQIENSALACLRLIIEANNARTQAAKLRKLDALNVEVEVLRSLLRVAYEAQFINGITSRGFAFFKNQAPFTAGLLDQARFANESAARVARHQSRVHVSGFLRSAASGRCRAGARRRPV